MVTRLRSAQAETALRHVGNCQICEGDQKLRDGRMVHHGYLRPGDGCIHGDCPGVDEVPYETSCDLIKVHKGALEYQRVGLRKRLTDVVAGHVTHFTRTRETWSGGLETTEYAVGVTDPYRFREATEHLRWELESHVRKVESTIVRFGLRISSWEPKPVRTVEEEVRKELEARAVRKAARDAARAERAAKRAATKAKQDALAERRRGIVAGIVGSLRALADQPASPERDASARRVWADALNRKKYPWLWTHELLEQGAEAPSLALGLTRRDPESGRVLY